MFDGGGSFGRGVDLGGKSKRAAGDRKQFLERQRKEKEARQEQQRKLQAAERIKRCLRSYVVLKSEKDSQRALFRKRLGDMKRVLSMPNVTVQMRAAVVLGLQKKMLPSFLWFFRSKEDTGLLAELLELITSTSTQTSTSSSWADSGWRIFAPDGNSTSDTTSPASAIESPALISDDSVSLFRWSKLLFLSVAHLTDRGGAQRSCSEEILLLLEHVQSAKVVERLSRVPAVFHFLRDSAITMGTNPMRKKARDRARLTSLWQKFAPSNIASSNISLAFLHDAFVARTQDYSTASKKMLVKEVFGRGREDGGSAPTSADGDGDVSMTPTGTGAAELQEPMSGTSATTDDLQGATTSRAFLDFRPHPGVRRCNPLVGFCEFIFSALLSKTLFAGNDVGCRWLSSYLTDNGAFLSSKTVLREYLFHYVAYSFLPVVKQPYVHAHGVQDMLAQLSALWLQRTMASGCFAGSESPSPFDPKAAASNGATPSTTASLYPTDSVTVSTSSTGSSFHNYNVKNSTSAVGVNSKYLSGRANENIGVELNRNAAREKARRAVAQLARLRNVGTDHPKLVLLAATGNLWSVLQSAVHPSLGSPAAPITGGNYSSNSSSSSISSTGVFHLLDLFSLLVDPEYDSKKLKIGEYMDADLRIQLSLKERRDFVKSLSEKCSLDDFLLCYFGSDLASPPHDSVLSVLAFSCKSFVTDLARKVLQKSADTWAREVLQKIAEAAGEGGGGATTIGGVVGTTSTGGSRNDLQIGGSSSSSSGGGAGGHQGRDLAQNMTQSSFTSNTLYILPFACVFRVQATVMYDTEFFSAEKNCLFPHLDQLATLVNRFAFLVLQDVENHFMSADSGRGGRGGPFAPAPPRRKRGGSWTDGGGDSDSEEHDGSLSDEDADLYRSLSGNKAGGGSMGLGSGNGISPGSGMPQTSGDGSTVQDASRMDIDQEGAILGTVVDKFGFTDFKNQPRRNFGRLPLFCLVQDKVCSLARTLYDRFRRRDVERELQTNATSSTTSAYTTARGGVTSSSTSSWTIAFSGGSCRRSNLVLTELPHCIPFEDRVSFLQEWIRQDQENRSNVRSPFFAMQGTRANIRRTHIVEDGFTAFQMMNEDQLRGAFRVVFIDANGETESGIDGGGLFKEFLLDLSRTAFAPDRGLFRETGERKLAPRPLREATLVYDSENMALQMFYFLGKVVGKAIYENCLLEPQFSRTFLNLLLNRPNTLDDLFALDRDFARNLIQTKESDVSEWGLYFCIDDSDLVSGGANAMDASIDLMPNGRNIPVTEENKISYIQRLAYYKTTTELERQSRAFKEGMLCVLDRHWLQQFDPYELNFLISGTPDLKFGDLEGCCTYAGGYTERSEVILWFWQILHNDFDHEQKGKFLQFVTSCSRAPLLGYASLHPPFCIHRVPDNERLPTASTCANLLKLPDYSSYTRLREKLLQAIYQGEGFHLS
ncbi:unnamed protein product [Amoebophrya sp. A25]|nr:unnamed protein product [Amoebophrya sp. A25]|eukprot:GSA25T00005734001.1